MLINIIWRLHFNSSFCDFVFRESWSSYYKEAPDRNDSNNPSHGAIKVNGGGSYYVLQCKFIGQNGNGAIFFQSNVDSTKLLLEYIIFESCSSTNRGGSLQFGNSGEIIQDHVFYHKSISLSSAHAYSNSISGNKRDILKFSNVFECGNFNKAIVNDPGGALTQVSDSNITKNNAKYLSSFDISGCQYGSFIQFTFMNDNLQDSNIEAAYNNFFFIGGPIIINHCNILNNKARPTKFEILFNHYTYDPSQIYNSIFINNPCKYTFTCYENFDERNACPEDTHDMDQSEIDECINKYLKPLILLKDCYLDDFQIEESKTRIIENLDPKQNAGIDDQGQNHGVIDISYYDLSYFTKNAKTCNNNCIIKGDTTAFIVKSLSVMTS